MRYEEVSEYVQKLVGEGDRLLAWVDRRSDELNEYGVFQIDSSRGRLLELLARLRSPKRVLEVGSGAGYSALWFLRGMSPDGVLDAIEQHPKVVQALQLTIKKAKLEKRIKIHQGRAIDVLPGMRGPYDIVFIDADKDGYPTYLDHALRLTKSGSVILADNMFWNGATIRGETREGAQAIAEYTKRIFNDPRLSSLIFPLGDGLALSYRAK